MKTFSIKQAINQGWKTFWDNWLFVVAVLVVSFVISWIFSFLSSAGDSILLQAIFTILSVVVQLLIAIGLTTIFLKLAKGEKVSWDDMIVNRRRFVPYLFVGILYQVIVFIGFIFLIIPGIYLAIRYQYAKLAIIDDPSLTIGKAFKQSAEMTKGVKWKLFGISFVFLGIGILGLIVLGVGLLVAIPTIAIAHASIFHVLKKYNQEHPVVANEPEKVAETTPEVVSN